MITYQDLYEREGLVALDSQFQCYLHKDYPHLLTYMLTNRGSSVEADSAWLIEMGMALQGFILQVFATGLLSANFSDLADIYACNDRFVRRRALNTYRSLASLLDYDVAQFRASVELRLGGQWTEIAFARAVLKMIDQEEDLEDFMRYAAWAVYSPEGQALHAKDVIFFWPLRERMNFASSENLFYSHDVHARKGFELTDRSAFDESLATFHANYCIFCHKRKKDSCSKGLMDNEGKPKGPSGCPLKEKISEMNYLKSRGYDIGALAVVVVNNPMCAGTGHRICTDCTQSCIYQKQAPVDIPLVETNVLNSVLALRYGFEIYSLLTRWNPLNLFRPLPEPINSGRALVVGMGPAGYTLAHYLLNEGHTVVGVEGNKVEPLNYPPELIEDISVALNKNLALRIPSGFGGVAEYGITVRWNKNYLDIIRLLLERRKNFALFDGVALGINLGVNEALESFDHVAIASGAGKPRLLDIPNSAACGVRYASDFLMSLHSGAPYLEDSISNLQIRMPLVVIGGGLTAVDAATEALAYYPVQIKKFSDRYAKFGKKISWTERELKIIEDFINPVPSKVTIAYRGHMIDSPAYKMNPQELINALEEGVSFLERAVAVSIEVDEYGDTCGINFDCCGVNKFLPARTIIVAIGTESNPVFADLDRDLFRFSPAGDLLLESDFFVSDRVSVLGDLNQKYAGSVVKAMASARDSYQKISQAIHSVKKERTDDLLKDLANDWVSILLAKNTLADGILELQIRSPLAARKFNAGQFYKLQNYHYEAVNSGYGSLMEGVALTGYKVIGDIVSLIILETGGSASIPRFFAIGQRIFVMGPTGEPTPIPENEVVMMIGGGLGNITALALGRAMKTNGCQVIYVAGYRRLTECVKEKEQEEVCDLLIRACDEGILPGAFSYHCNVVEAIERYAQEPMQPIALSSVTKVITVGSCGMMGAVQALVSANGLFSGNVIGIASINAPMQCMLKGLCGQCMQKIDDKVIFCCRYQDQELLKVDFTALACRLRQNSVQEKLTALLLQGGA